MKTWKGYTLIDLALITSGMFIVTLSGIVFNSSWYIIINTLFGLLYVFAQAKGKISTQFLGIIHFSFYIFIAYTQKFYGEALLYLVIMLPMHIYGAIHWLMYKDKKNNVVLVRNSLSKTELVLSGIVLISLSVLIYFFLRMLDTKLLLINSLSFITMLPGLYLLIRRCRWNHVAFIINDFIVPILWILLVIEGDYSFIPMCIYHVFQLLYDLYGIIEWTKLSREQKQQANIQNKIINIS